MLRILQRLFRGRKTPAALPNRNEQFLSRAFYDSLLATYWSLPEDKRDITLPTPTFSNQGSFPQCVGEAVAGVLSTMRQQGHKVPDMQPRAIYEAAVAVDGLPDRGGTWLYKGMDAVGLPWARLHMHPDVLFAVMRVLERPVAYAFDFHRTDYQTGASGRVMIPSHGGLGGHAVVLHGIRHNVQYRLYPGSRNLSTSRCALLRNTNTPWDEEPWLYPAWRMATDRGAMEACIFLLDGEY